MESSVASSAAEKQSEPQKEEVEEETEEDSEDEDSEEEEEPKLKYERISGDLREILKRDGASCIAANSKVRAVFRTCMTYLCLIYLYCQCIRVTCATLSVDATHLS